ncbi:MAG: branched-chain amino acid ABC transporter permease [Nitrospinota bacterium]|nr:MAG: branched-chain amino acid ABC transporter permease [Nitrospinota bacterium]
MQPIWKSGLIGLLLVVLLLFPFFSPSPYIVHMAILIFIWAYIATVWSFMGRFELLSLGHGAFLGLGAYTSTLLFNFYNLSPWIGMFCGGIAAALLALLIGYPCFRYKVIGDYFVLVTLALGEIVRLVIILFREVTGGSLGMTLRSLGTAPLYLQFTDKRYFYYITMVFWLAALYLWARLDKSMTRNALLAIGEDEVAAASIGISVTRNKLKVTLLSAFLTALAGALYAQYVTYLNPSTLSGVGISLQIAFMAILGGAYSFLGPTVGAAIITILSESLRVSLGGQYAGLSEMIYGALLVIFIIFLPTGVYGSLRDLLVKKLERPAS